MIASLVVVGIMVMGLTGFPLVIIIAIIYKGILREMFSDFGHMTKEEIVEAGALPEEKK